MTSRFAPLAVLAFAVLTGGCTVGSVVGTTVGVGVGVGTGAVRAGVGVTSAVIDLAIPDGEDCEDAGDEDRRHGDDEDTCEARD